MVKRHAGLILISMGYGHFLCRFWPNRCHGSIVPYPTGTGKAKGFRHYRNRRRKALLNLRVAAARRFANPQVRRRKPLYEKAGNYMALCRAMGRR